MAAPPEAMVLALRPRRTPGVLWASTRRPGLCANRQVNHNHDRLRLS
jgi:hypothetical protein